MSTFSFWDYLMLLFTLLVSAGIGVYYRFTGGKQKTTKEYFLADGGGSLIPVSFSLVASFMSAISLMGLSTEIYSFGTLFLVINFSYIYGTAVAAYLYLPVFFKMQTTSAYEYLEKRFGATTRLCASLAYSLQMILYMGIVLYAPALTLEAITDISKENSILIIGLVCTFYSTIGGMKAVLLTDVVQALLMFAAVYSIIVCVVIQAGGFSPIWQVAAEGGRLDFWNFDLDPTTRHTWFTLVIGGGFTYMSLYAVNQTQVQRLLTVKSLKKSQMTMFINWPILSLLSLSTGFSGLALYYYYAKCDPVLAGRIQSRDQIMPLFVIDAMGDYPGLPGVFVSGIFSASLSTISAAMNSLAAVTLEDYIKPLYLYIYKNPLPESKSTAPSKIIACIYGFVCIGIAFLAQFWGGLLQASFTIFGVIGGPLFGLFTLGMFVPRANQRGAVIGMAMAIVFLLWVGFGGPKPPAPTLSFSTEGCKNDHLFENITRTRIESLVTSARDTGIEYFYLYRISYLWYSPIGFCITLFGGWFLSWMFECCGLAGDKVIFLDAEKKIFNVDLFSPPIAKRLQRENAKYLENNFTVDNANPDICDLNTKF